MFSFLYSLDVLILELVNHSFHNMLTDNVAMLISYMGLLAFWVAIIILLYLFGGQKGKT